MSTHEPTPSDQPPDQFKPAVDPSDLVGNTVDLEPTLDSVKQYLLSRDNVDRLNLTVLPGSFIDRSPGRVAKGAYTGDELSLGYTSKETNDLPQEQFDEIVTEYYDLIASAAKDIRRDDKLGTDDDDRLEERLAALNTALITLVADYDKANKLVDPSFFEQFDYIYNWRKPWVPSNRDTSNYRI